MNFHPKGRAGGFHLLRYKGLAIADYGVALKCLAYESLRLVQDSDNYKNKLSDDEHSNKIHIRFNPSWNS
jgi:hypothetical protein